MEPMARDSLPKSRPKQEPSCAEAEAHHQAASTSSHGYLLWSWEASYCCLRDAPPDELRFRV